MPRHLYQQKWYEIHSWNLKVFRVNQIYQWCHLRHLLDFGEATCAVSRDVTSRDTCRRLNLSTNEKPPPVSSCHWPGPVGSGRFWQPVSHGEGEGARRIRLRSRGIHSRPPVRLSHTSELLETENAARPGLAWPGAGGGICTALCKTGFLLVYLLNLSLSNSTCHSCDRFYDQLWKGI